MGSGCTCQSSTENNSPDRIRLCRQGNLSFYIHDILISGRGCKKTLAWETTLTREEINSKIKEFWETRVEGSPVIWNILQQACADPDESKAEELVKTYGLTLTNGLIQQVYDGQGCRYDLPPFVINPAVKYGEAKLSVKEKSAIKVMALNLIFRAVGREDVSLSIETTQKVKKVKEMYCEKSGISGELRMFYSGKELKDEGLIGERGIQNGFVIQVIIKT